MLKKTKSILSVLILILSSHLSGVCQTISSNPITVEAVVVGSSVFGEMTFINGRSEAYLFDDVLIRVVTDGDLKKGQYVRFQYDHQNKKASLPEEMFTSKKRWEFKLTRNEKCDISMKELLYYDLDGKTHSYLELTGWTKEKKLPLEAVVSCYILSAGDYRKL